MQYLRDAKHIFDVQVDYAFAANGQQRSVEEAEEAIRAIHAKAGHKPSADVITAAVLECLLVRIP